VSSEARLLRPLPRHLRSVPPPEVAAESADSPAHRQGAAWVLPGMPRTPGRARGLVREWCQSSHFGERVTEHVVLAANELVTRAVRGEARRVLVSVTLEDRDVLVEVSDPSAQRAPRRGGAGWLDPSAQEDDCSWRLVDGLATTWGVTRTGRTGRAWARVPAH